ncbi:hypothetical protein BDZ94DRAFT_1325982 [Collybia nuda]|uniref:WD40 repeat-like protein n=1 Tax=Collybia nuda TaxID=64659 RepID=A0A9P6CEC4_9AGAR|nr:hypothetical protein BDZ94DRAFT_1325982 [Collybia nuda]
MTVLQSHTGSLICLSATDDGKLASGGVDGVRIWNLNNVTQLERPSGAGHRGATTALAWIRREDEPDDGLVYGTANGFLVCWKETQREEETRGFEETYCVQVAIPGEITAIAFEAGSNRLAICNRNLVVQIFLTGPNMDLHHVYSVVINDHVPKAIAFAQIGGEYKDIMTFGLYDGLIHTLRGVDGTIHTTRSIGCMIGNAAVNPKRGVFCVDDPLQGVALYRLDSGARVRTYEVTAKKTPRPRQVTFAEDCSVILSGSDHGVGASSDVEIVGVPHIFAAISRGGDGASDIIVWQRVPEKIVEPEPVEDNREIWRSFKGVLQILMCAATIAFMWQNLGLNVVVTEKIGNYIASVSGTKSRTYSRDKAVLREIEDWGKFLPSVKRQADDGVRGGGGVGAAATSALALFGSPEFKDAFSPPTLLENLPLNLPLSEQTTWWIIDVYLFLNLAITRNENVVARISTLRVSNAGGESAGI